MNSQKLISNDVNDLVSKIQDKLANQTSNQDIAFHLFDTFNTICCQIQPLINTNQEAPGELSVKKPCEKEQIAECDTKTSLTEKFEAPKAKKLNYRELDVFKCSKSQVLPINPNMLSPVPVYYQPIYNMAHNYYK